MPPKLTINIVDVKPVVDSLIPTMGFRLAITNSSGENATSCSLYGDVFIKVIEEDKPKELFWGTIHVIVPSSINVGQNVEHIGRLACPYDVDLSVSKYLNVVGDEIPIKVDFYGSYTFPSSPFTGLIPKISKEYALPSTRWRRMLHEYYRDILWIAVRKDTFEELKKILEERELHTHDEAIRSLLKRKERTIKQAEK